ncbi:MAG: acyl-CoA dehydrogenase, partial [Erythrobacter sp.]|nr:acyl-CoA dehydrogenase [Erythrobacter sp.]
MDFEPTERQAYWRDRVRDFIETHVRPNMDTYKAQDAEGDRWKVIQIIEDKKKLAKEAGL